MIEYVQLHQAQELDDFVIHHPNGHFMQTSLWGNFRTDWNWIGILCRRDGKILGTMALLWRTVRFFGSALLYAPRGPVLEHEDTNTFFELLDAAKFFARQQRGYLLRMDPPVLLDSYEFIGTAIEEGFNIDPRADFTTFNPKLVYQLDLCGLDVKTLPGIFHAKVRYNTRLAQRRGVTIREGGVEDIPAFSAMMEQTAQHDGFHARNSSYFVRLLQTMPEYTKLFCAELDGKIIAAAIYLQQGNRAWYLYGCSDLAHRSEKPNDLLQYHMIAYALQHGCTLYDFRGVEGYPCHCNPKIGLHQFKQGFGGELVEYIGQMDLVLRPAMYKLITTTQALVTKCKAAGDES